MVDVTSCEYAVLYTTLYCTYYNVTGKIKIRLKFFALSLNLNFLCLLALIIHELGVGHEKIENHSRLKFNLNLI